MFMALPHINTQGIYCEERERECACVWVCVCVFYLFFDDDDDACTCLCFLPLAESFLVLMILAAYSCPEEIFTHLLTTENAPLRRDGFHYIRWNSWVDLPRPTKTQLSKKRKRKSRYFQLAGFLISNKTKYNKSVIIVPNHILDMGAHKYSSFQLHRKHTHQ